MASASWLIVRPGVIFPPRALLEHEEQVGDAGQDQVPLDAAVVSHLRVVEPQFGLGVLEAPLDAPARERHAQELLRPRPRRRVREEVFHLARLRVARNQQCAAACSVPLAALRKKPP